MLDDEDQVIEESDPFADQADAGEDPCVPFAEMSVSGSSRPPTDANLDQVEREHLRRFFGRGKRILPRAAAGTVGLLIFTGAGFAAWRGLRRTHRRPHRFWKR